MLILYVGIAWRTDFDRISFHAADRNQLYQLDSLPLTLSNRK